MSFAAGLMTHRARIQRNAAQVDSWGTGRDKPSDFQTIKDDQKCFITLQRRADIVDGEKVLSVEDLLGIFPKGADVQRGDRLVQVRDRNDVEVVAGTLEVDDITSYTLGPGKSHLEAKLRRHRGKTA